VLFLAGATRIDLVKSIANGENVATKLEALFMANGYVAARFGWLNQSDAKGLMDAKALIAAAKHGGQDTEEHNPVSTAGAAIYDELRAVARITRQTQARNRIAAITGETLEEQ
jgi:hypothetical protein